MSRSGAEDTAAFNRVAPDPNKIVEAALAAAILEKRRDREPVDRKTHAISKD